METQQLLRIGRRAFIIRHSTSSPICHACFFREGWLVKIVGSVYFVRRLNVRAIEQPAELELRVYIFVTCFNRNIARDIGM